MGWTDHILARHDLSWIDIGYEVNECAREGRSLAEFHRWMHREYGASFDHVHDEHGQLRRQVPTGP